MIIIVKVAEVYLVKIEIFLYKFGGNVMEQKGEYRDCTSLEDYSHFSKT